MLRIKQIRSKIGSSKRQKDTLKALGLKRINDTVVQPDTKVIQGMINRVSGLVLVEKIDGD
ncbi:50S ribosomal protein L30 [candidate division WOR-3 bacterium]|nr:50S ribosomal protein L30 [candidate division WOR-3 bacterium]